jgi:hypothetical protein
MLFRERAELSAHQRAAQHAESLAAPVAIGRRPFDTRKPPRDFAERDFECSAHRGRHRRDAEIVGSADPRIGGRAPPDFRRKSRAWPRQRIARIMTGHHR